MNRIEANRKLLGLLEEALCKNPNLRFIQALWGLKIIDYDNKGIVMDRFYEEPSKTLERIGYENS